jgi:hypothetical protein
MIAVFALIIAAQLSLKLSAGRFTSPAAEPNGRAASRVPRRTAARRSVRQSHMRRAACRSGRMHAGLAAA